ncbi:glycosyltransferase family 2 protein [Pediococcus pentosaceus]|uniref:glycosyltransferase family 2 protein n=1 Tax=Pediococcus pentosaceus TaxID=1255 RepID=UPI00223BCE0B|nr:glycosyltransferase family A protein [Pediococcus pentosaceus]
MKQNLISIIVPVYNVEKHIEGCLSSILKQTYKNFELIIINDGSTDNSLKNIEKMNFIQNKKIITTKNLGISAARNRGIRESSGEFITFIDSDDVVEPDYLEYLLGLLQKFNVDISSCQHIVEFNNKKNIDMSFNEQSCFMSSHDWLQDVLLMNKVDLSPWGKLYKADLFNDDTFPEGKLFEDTYAIPTIISKTKGVAVGNEAKYHYKIRKDSITRSEFKMSALDLISSTNIMTKRVLEVFPDLNREVKVRKAWAGVSTLSNLLRSKDAKQYKGVSNKIRKNLLKIASPVIFTTKSKLELKIALILIFMNINLYKLFLLLRDK